MDDRFEKVEREAGSATFEQWFERMCTYVRQRPDPELRAVYYASLGRVSLEILDDAFRVLIEQPDAPKGKIPAVAAIWREIRRRPEPREPAPMAPDVDDPNYMADLLKPLIVRGLLGLRPITDEDGPEAVVRVARYVTTLYQDEYPAGAYVPPDAAAEFLRLGVEMLQNEMA